MVYLLFVKIGGLHMPPEKLWRILWNSFKCLLLQNYVANSAIILYVESLVSLIAQFEKIGQRDLIKKNYSKICKKHILIFF